MRGQRKQESSKRQRAVAAGHICIDITPCSEREHGGGRKDTGARTAGTDGGGEYPSGGAVANTGLAMKHLGVDVRLMGKIGKDELGTLSLTAWRNTGRLRI